MHDDQHSISDSMSSLGRSSSSGISPDYDTDSSIPRRWTEGDLEGLAGGHPKSFNLADNTRCKLPYSGLIHVKRLMQ